MTHCPLETEALRATLAPWRQAHPAMGVLALLPEAEKAGVSLLQGLCRELGISLIGAIFPALVASTGFVMQGVWLLCLERMQPAMLIEDLNAGPIPAFEVYQELIQSEYGINLTPENFYQHAVHYPVGVLRGGGFVIRIPVAMSDDGSIFCVGEVPQDAALVLLKAPPPNNDGCINRLVRHLERENGALAHRHLLTFYCAGRRMHLGSGAEEELAVLNALTRASVFGGALSLGEIGDTQFSGIPQFHNATLVCAPWAA